jgi:hypothetical protein
MSAKSNMLVVSMVLLALSGAVHGRNATPYIGIQLDPSPLPGLLTKHLGLKREQGIRIQNVSLASPADEIGLERDDIIVRFQGRDATSVDGLVDAIQSEKVGATVSLEIVHLGQRKTLTFELKPMGENPRWKHPPEPEIVTSWRPGKFFRMGPNGENWMEVPFDKVPDINIDVKKFLQERYTYHHATDGEEYTITIEGDPKDTNTRIVVEADNAEHSATVGQIDGLPERYRAAAREALDSARQLSRQRLGLRNLPLPELPDPGLYRQYFKDLTVPMPDFDKWSDRHSRILERIQEQMERLGQRMEQLEQRYRQAPSHPQNEQDKADDGGKPAGNVDRPAPKRTPTA